jgi:hypothetical protein
MRVALYVTNTSPPKDRKKKTHSSLGFFTQNKITASLSGSFQQLQKHRVDSKIGICKNTSSSCSPKLQNPNTTRSEKRSKNFHYRSQSFFQNLCNIAEEPMAVFSQFTKV